MLLARGGFQVKPDVGLVGGVEWVQLQMHTDATRREAQSLSAPSTV